jgi:hypothetical protein
MSENSLPQTLDSSLFGPLALSEIRIPGFYAFNYTAECSPNGREPFTVVFHPPSHDVTAWQQHLKQAETRGRDIIACEQAILLTGKKVFRGLFKSYQISPADIEKVIPFLKLSMIKLISSGNDELVYGPCQPFPSFDLTIELDRDFRVTDASFDG